MMAGCGLPGFANFPGEALVLFGAWKTFPIVTAIAIWGALVIGAVYMLRAIRNILHGPTREGPSADRAIAISLWQKLPYALLLGCFAFIRIFPAVANR